MDFPNYLEHTSHRHHDTKHSCESSSSHHCCCKQESSSSHHSPKSKQKTTHPKSKSPISHTDKKQESKPHKKYCCHHSWKLKNQYYAESTEVSVFVKQVSKS